MSKRLAQVLTFAGALVFIAGLVLTIVLINETGQVVDDSECDAMGAVATADVQLAACVTSDDPKVLIGVAVLLLGGTMSGVGIWQWVVAAQREPGGGGGLMGSIQSLQDKAMQLQQESMQAADPPKPTEDPPAPTSSG
jgi:hypothetical protein